MGSFRLSKVYLTLYNLCALLGWMYLWYLQIAFYFQSEKSFWEMIEVPLKIIQTSALLEIFHAAFNLVRSPVMFTSIQILGRLIILWGYANISVQSQQSLSMNLLIHAWSLIEVPRYLFYLLKVMEIKIPRWLLFLRYNLFYLLYPAGMAGEILTIIHSLPFIKRTMPFSIALPNKWNVVFNYYCFSLMWICIYLPIGPIMINNMRKQRQKNWVNAQKKKE